MPRGRGHRHGGGGGTGTVRSVFVAGQMAVHPDHIWTMKTAGKDGECGCPVGCQANTVYVDMSSQQLPAELVGLYDLEQYKKFALAINDALQNNYCAPCPCMLTHFCIPFSPVCAMIFFANSRKNSLNELKEAENKLIMNTGLYWASDENYLPIHGVFFLKMNQQTRAQYEAQNPAAVRLIERKAAQMSNQNPAWLASQAMFASIAGSMGIQGAGAMNPMMNMMNPGMMNAGMMNPGMMNPGMMNPGMMNPGMMNPGFQYPQGPYAPAGPQVVPMQMNMNQQAATAPPTYAAPTNPSTYAVADFSPAPPFQNIMQ